MRPISLSLVVFLLATTCLQHWANAQCSSQWSSGGPQPHLTGTGECTTLWDPDGAGPAPQRLVVGGQHLIGGSAPIHQSVMTWDGSQWQALGPGPGNGSGTVKALTVWNGQLVAGGDFTGGGMDYIALWNGSSWQPIGVGAFTIPVHALTVWNGNLVAAATYFLGVGPVSSVRTWDGVAWTSLALPWAGPVFAMTSYQGHLCLGGSFTLVPDGILARWDGTAWLPSIFAQAKITSFAVRQSPFLGGAPTLFAGGAFTSIGGTAASRIAWTLGGTTFAWNALGGGLTNQCNALQLRVFGFDYALLALTASGVTEYLSTTGSWTSLGIPQLASIAYYAGSYHAASPSVNGACLRYDAPNNRNVHTLTVYFQDSRGTSPGVFLAGPNLATGTGVAPGWPMAVAAADLDDDGDIDIVSANDSRTVSLFFGGR